MRSVIRPFVPLLVMGVAAQAMAQSDGTTTNRLTGLVRDATTNQALSFASIAVFRQVQGKDSLLMGSQADERGAFVVPNLPVGILIMRVTFVGYQTLTVRLGEGTTDLGTMSLQPDASLLREVNVVGEKSEMTMTMEKRTFTVAENLTTIGGTAENVLTNVPSITLDKSGSPSLRNMPTIAYVNGKPTQLTLAQIPANQIESVEVISNPTVSDQPYAYRNPGEAVTSSGNRSTVPQNGFTNMSVAFDARLLGSGARVGFRPA